MKAFGSDYPRPFTLARAECGAWLAGERLKGLSAKPTAEEKRQVVKLLEACARHGYPPPAELIELVAKALACDAAPRDSIHDKVAFVTAAKLRAENGDALSTRALAKQAGVPHKTMVNWERTADFAAHVEYFSAAR